MSYRPIERRIELILVAFIVGIAIHAGCTKAYRVHPGAANVTDSKAYDALLVSKAAIDQAKIELAKGTLPAAAKADINSAVTAYNVARAAYIAYHDAALAGKDTAAMLAKLQQDLDNVAAAIAMVQQQAGAKP